MRLFGRTLTSTEVRSWTLLTFHCTSIPWDFRPSFEMFVSIVAALMAHLPSMAANGSNVTQFIINNVFDSAQIDVDCFLFQMHQRSQWRATPMMMEHHGSPWWRCWRSSAYQMPQEETAPTWWQTSCSPSCLCHTDSLSCWIQVFWWYSYTQSWDLTADLGLIEPPTNKWKYPQFITLWCYDSFQLKPISFGL